LRISKPAAAAKRLRYRIGSVGETIIGHAVKQDVATGLLEEAYIEDLGDVSSSPETVVERANYDLSTSLAVPE
jgi:hypothetical protein